MGFIQRCTCIVALIHLCAICCVIIYVCMYVCTYVQEVATADAAYHFEVLPIDNNCYSSSTACAASIDTFGFLRNTIFTTISKR